VTDLHILVVAKSPVPGRVKTRLMPLCTPTEAARLAEAALADTLQAVAACNVTRRLVALDGEPGEWLPPGFEVFAQYDGTFAERLDHAWSTAGGPGLQIGMDTPQVTAELLDECLALTINSGSEPGSGPQAGSGREAGSVPGAGSGPSATLGLAEDGGWWALGLTDVRGGMFDHVPMSAPNTGREQWRRLELLGLQVTALPQLIDVDHVDDAVAVAQTIPSSRFGRLVDQLQLAQRLRVSAAS